MIVKKNKQHIIGLRCTICHHLYSPDEVQYVCPHHGYEGILDIEYDYDFLREELAIIDPNTRFMNLYRQGMFAYRSFLPVAVETPPPPLLVGATPLYQAPRLATACGVKTVWLKDDGRNPTASLKDRASAIAIMKAHEIGAEIITTASTGNAAAALAGLAASSGQKSVIFVPATTPEAKIAQLCAYGATVLLVDGTYDMAFDLCLQATDAFGWYCRNTAYNPYMVEGKKTVIFELYDQFQFAMLENSNMRQQGLGWQMPLTHIFLSVGDGCIISGVYKGLRDLVAVKLLTHMPRLIGVQASGSNYLYQAWTENEDVLTKSPIAAQTVADSIRASLPRDRIKAMTAVRATNGAFIEVSDQEILAAIPALAQGSGVYAEPAAAAAYAGLQKAVAMGQVGPDAQVALIITGSGLKDAQAVRQIVGQTTLIEPNLTAVEMALSEMMN